MCLIKQLFLFVFVALATEQEGDPILTYNAAGKEVKEHDSVGMECSLNYTGSAAPAPQLQPYFYWKNGGGQPIPIYSNSTTDSTAVSQLTVTAGRSNIPSYSCHVYFQLDPPFTPSYSNDTPTICSNASSPIIEVSYAPSTPAITSKPDVISIDGVTCGISVLNCFSAGNPPPTYRWFDSAMNILDITVTLTLAEINRPYRCEAKNTIGTTSTDHNVSQDSCSTTVQCCVFPYDDTTTVTRKGCDNGTLCDCSENKSGITLFCNVTTYPNSSYIWTEPGGMTFGPTDSPLYDQVSANGTYQCTAYFDKSSSNYSGGVDFPNGTSSISVNECSREASKTTRSMVSSSVATSTTKNDQIPTTAFQPKSENNCGTAANAAAIALGVLFFISLAANIIQMVILIWNRRATRDPFKRTGKILQPDMLDLSPETQTPTAYEELRRPTENNLQLSTYEELRHRPTIDTNQ